MLHYIPRYGLKSEPFEIRPLDPLSFPEDANLFAEMFINVPAYKELAEIDLYVKEYAPRMQPLFFLVKGRDGCGRSSVANFILSRYCAHRNIKPENFIVPKRSFDHMDPYAIWLEWMGLLINQIEYTGQQGPDVDGLRKSAMEAKVDNYRFVLQPVAWKLAAQLSKMQNEPWGFGVCLDEVRVSDIISAATTIFQLSQTVCVFTVGEFGASKKKIIDSFEQSDPQNKMCLRLPPLSGADVRELVHARWRRACNRSVKSPFPHESDRAFADRERPVKWVMMLLNQLLELKLAPTYMSGKTWPGDPELGFEVDELRCMIKILESKPKVSWAVFPGEDNNCDSI